MSYILAYETTSTHPRYNLIPCGTVEGIINFIEHGAPVGGFLEALLSNDLMEAFTCADSRNTEAMFQIVCFLRNEIPGRHSGMWGDRDKVAKWVGGGGLEGRRK